MVEKQSRRVQDALKKIVEDIEANHIRKMQANMHRCSARCCDNSNSSMEEVFECVRNCSQGLQEAEQLVQSEISTVQNRLQRCILDCNDNVKDRMGATPSEAEVSKYQTEFECCATKCVDHHVASLPTMFKRMKEILQKKQENTALYYPS